MDNKTKWQRVFIPAERVAFRLQGGLIEVIRDRAKRRMRATAYLRSKGKIV